MRINNAALFQSGSPVQNLIPATANANGRAVDVSAAFGGSVQVVVAAIAPPTLSSATPSASGGTLATATYYYVLTALNANGESLKSNELSAAVTGPTGSVALAWTAVPGATSYRVYRGTATGAENVYYGPGNVTSYTDTGAANTGGSPPTASVAGTVQLQASNDTARQGDGTITPTNWTNVAGAVVTVAGAGTYLIDQLSLGYMAVRAVWTNNSSGGGTVSATAKFNGY